MFHQLQCATARDQSFKAQAYEGQLRFELEPCRWQRPVLTWAVLQDFLGCSVTEAHHLLEVFQDSPLIRMPFVLSLAHIPYVILGSSGAWDVLDLFLFLGSIIGLYATWEFYSPPSIEGVPFPPKYWEFFIKH